MIDLVDNKELNELLDKLEMMEDEEEAASLLRQFNQASSKYGKIIINLDDKIPHEEWKANCDKAKKELDDIISKIKSL